MPTPFSSGFARYLKNTLWLFGEKVLSILAALFISIWMARHLGPEDFGLLNFAVNFAALFTSLAALGLSRILERDLVKHKQEIRATLSTSFAMVITAAVLTYIAIIVAALFIDYGEHTTLLIAIVAAACFFQVNTIFTSYYYSQVMAKQYARISLLALSISNCVKVIIILADASLSLFALTFVLDGALLFVFLFISTRGTEAFPKFSLVSKARAKHLLGQSWPYMLSGLLISIYMKIDTLMIKEMLGDNAVGQYSAAARLSEGVYFLPVTIVSSIYPAIVNAKEKSHELYENRLSNLYSMMFYMALGVSVFVGLFSDLIISTLYGAQYNESAQVLTIHIWASVFVFVGVCSGRWLLTENFQRLAAVNTFIGTAANIALNLLLIPKYGIVGAAWATLISYGVTGYFTFFLWKKTRGNFMLMTKSVFKLPKIRH